MPEMESLQCRFRVDRAILEALAGTLFSVGIGALAPQAIDPRLISSDQAFLGGFFVSMLFLPLLFRLRWRSRFRMDDRGVEFRRSGGRLATRLDWGEIDEIFLLGPVDFELRGGGRRIRFAGPYDHLEQACERCAPRLDGIRDQLRSRALEEGRVVFRMPAGTWKAHLAYLGAVLVLTAMTGFCLAPLFKRSFFSFPIVVVLMGSGWLWSLRKRASGLGTRVMLHRQGIVVRRLDGKDRVPWRDFDHSEWNEGDGLNLVLRSRRVISLPASLSNLAMLEEFLRAGPPSIDSHPPEEPEGRTMMQSP
jgi:hypothetical protein